MAKICFLSCPAIFFLHLSELRVLQRKAIIFVARAKYNAHTDTLFKAYNIPKFDDIVHLTQTVFIH